MYGSTPRRRFCDSASSLGCVMFSLFYAQHNAVIILKTSLLRATESGRLAARRSAGRVAFVSCLVR